MAKCEKHLVEFDKTGSWNDKQKLVWLSAKVDQRCWSSVCLRKALVTHVDNHGLLEGRYVGVCTKHKTLKD